jgi:acetyl esterase/lipase
MPVPSRQLAAITFTDIAGYTVLIFTALIFLMAYPVSGQDVTTTDDVIPYSKHIYTYKIVDNHEIQANVYRYPGEEVRPAIIWIHGGALIFGTRNGLSSEQLEQYMKAGYNVVSIDYRLAPETKLVAIIKDLEDAYAWVRSKGPALFNIDPDRIAVVGHSAGGYLTLMAGFHLKPRPSALVSFYGYGDITGPWYSQPDSFYNQMPSIPRDQAIEYVGDSTVFPNGRSKFYLYCRQQGLWPKEVSGHDPVKEASWFFEYEPLRNISPSYPPTLLLHGEKDTDVPYEQSVLMAKAFKHHNVDYEFITKPDWGHGFDGAGLKDRSVQEAFDRILKFLEKHVR